jgi:hypothetical protein
MSRLKEIVFGEGNIVSLQRIENGEVVYHVLNKQNATLISFRIPYADQLGATFELIDSPKFFMRWIRKELERRDAEAEFVKQAKEDWEKEERK